MKILLDIADSKVEFVLDLLKKYDFVTAEPITPYMARVYSDIKKAIDEMNKVKQGKQKSIALDKFLDDLQD